MDLSEWLDAQFKHIEPEISIEELEAGDYEVIKGPITQEMLDEWLGMIGVGTIAQWVEMVEYGPLEEEEMEKSWEEYYQALESGEAQEFVIADPEPAVEAVILEFPTGKRLN